MRIVLLGPPGSGRRTLAKKLASHFGLKYLNLSELLGQMAQEDTELARLVGELLSACAPIPEELVATALNGALSDSEARQGFILDDYPREIGHADILDNILNGRGSPLDVVIAMGVDADDLMERLVGRLHCDSCGADYNIYTNPPMVDGVCDMCGGRIARRPTDYEETIANRLRVYEGNAVQLATRYRGQGILHEVRGTGDDLRVLSACVKIVDEAPPRELPPPRASAEAEEEPKAARRRGPRKAEPQSRSKKTAEAPTVSKAAKPERTKGGVKKAQLKEAGAKKSVAKKSAAKKAIPKKGSVEGPKVKKTVKKKAPATKAVTKKVAAKTSPAKKADAKKVMAKKKVARKAAPKKAASKKSMLRTTAPVKKKAPVKKAVRKAVTKPLKGKRASAAKKAQPTLKKKPVKGAPRTKAATKKKTVSRKRSR